MRSEEVNICSTRARLRDTQPKISETQVINVTFTFEMPGKHTYLIQDVLRTKKWKNKAPYSGSNIFFALCQLLSAVKRKVKDLILSATHRRSVIFFLLF